jgi:hypothetical protein
LNFASFDARSANLEAAHGLTNYSFERLEVGEPTSFAVWVKV